MEVPTLQELTIRKIVEIVQDLEWCEGWELYIDPIIERKLWIHNLKNLPIGLRHKLSNLSSQMFVHIFRYCNEAK